MKLTSRCYPCILEDMSGAMRLLGIDEKKSREMMREAVSMMARDGASLKPPSHYITAVHRIIKHGAGIDEPFAELRAKTNAVGIEIAARIRYETQNIPDNLRFRQRALWSVAANHLDFRTVGTGYGFDTSRIYSMLEQQIAKGLTIDMLDDFYRIALKSKNILFIHDNVGEVAIDAVFIEELKSIGARVTSALRGGPITSDATLSDGKAAGIYEAADRVILAGPDTLGISLDEMTPELAEALKMSDIVISKGQANYYVLTEYIESNPATVVFMFSNKCDPVAERFGLKGIHNMVWIASNS